MMGKRKTKAKVKASKVWVRFLRNHNDSILGAFIKGKSYEIAASDMWRLEIYPDRYEETRKVANSEEK